MCNLKVSALGFEPVLDVALGISGETQHEVPLDLQLIDGLDGLMDLNGNTHITYVTALLLFVHLTLQLSCENDTISSWKSKISQEN